MSEAIVNVQPLDGKLVKKEGWQYENDYTATDDLITEQNAIIALRKELKEREQLHRDACAKLAYQGLPPSWVIATVSDIHNKRFRYTVKCYGLSFTEEKKPAPASVPDPPKQIDPYEALAQRHDLKQILNSGVLTRNEKRKVLGLPEIKDETP